ncbi:PREDICTED: uncharacterized protein LOC109184089 isoform X2 [Ipomoea nil]|uniref:uncharacterized protein LOC109184089 isoform X2 n=1 Tax=Ipomoea nil TaxID=35883 RepID=UPI000900A7C1|nr:PREDICTED: uncharacterized protein LOC109184089 isoform X2 [Ipomoea nil]
MQCSNETISRLFYNASSSFQLLLFFSYVTSIFLAKLFYFLGGNFFSFFQRNQEAYEFAGFSDDDNEEVGDEKRYTYHHQSTLFASKAIHGGGGDEGMGFDGGDAELPEECSGSEAVTACSSPAAVEACGPSDDDEEAVQPKIPTAQHYFDSSNNSYDDSDGNNKLRTTLYFHRNIKNGVFDTSSDIDNFLDCYKGVVKKEKRGMVRNFMDVEEDFFVFSPSKLENKKKFEFEEKENMNKKEEGFGFGDGFTVGSCNSKTSSESEWRSSIKYSEDPFSSSSRRSCPTWESYAVFQKYDEEMLFLDRISIQKLHETESLKSSIQSCPRSISERIACKLTTRNKTSSSDFRHINNPYRELEAAYVAQICLTWEALNWNYNYFQRLRVSFGGRETGDDHGCPPSVAQQFQQFQVLLQRYIENEPYEHGRRPEIYARMRSLAPKLLQVPEYRDSDEKGEEGSRVPSESFLRIMEEGMRTFMNFLKADKENHCRIIASFFRKNRRGSADPTLLLLLKKVNKKKKSKVKEIKRAGKCLRKKWLKEEEEMEILMAEIDLKVVSRVLRMTELNDEQLHWCEDKMSKLKISDAKLFRDSSTLFYPATCTTSTYIHPIQTPN